MKSKLLKKLRKLSKKIFSIRIRNNEYSIYQEIFEVDYAYTVKIANSKSFEEITKMLNEFRRNFILKKVQVLKEEKINKQLKNY